MKLTPKQRQEIKDSLTLCFDYNRTPPGYLRLAPIETRELPWGISTGMSASHEDQEQAKELVTTYLVDFIEMLFEDDVQNQADSDVVTP